MIKAIRIVLGLDAGGFLGGINKSKSAWEGFSSSISGGVGNAVAFFGHLSEIVQGTIAIVSGLANSIKGLFDSFIGGVARQQRFISQLGILMGSADEAKQFVDNLSDSNAHLGFVTEDMLPALTESARALKAMDGVVDPAKLEKYTDLLRRIKAARPDVDYQSIASAISAFIQGDVAALKKLVGVSADDIEGLSEKSRKALENIQGTQETQLGQVTRVSGGAKAKSDELLAVLDEVTEKLGMGQEAIDEYGNTWDGQIARLQEMWNRFKDAVGTPILEALIPELQKLGDWLEEHKEDIEAFAEKLGGLAADGLINAMEALMNVDWQEVGNGAQAILEAFSQIDWVAIGNTVSGISQFLGEINKISGTPSGSPVSAGEAAGQGFKDLANQAAQGADPNGVAAQNANNLFESLGIHITWGFDKDGQINIRNIAQEEAGKAVSAVVDNATKSQSNTSSGNRH